jgi:predicted dehydrogenase
VTLVHGSYLQDWLLYPTDYNWRLESQVCGPSRCVADIGSHWMDAVQHVTGARIVEVCADLATVIPVRKKPKAQVETFSIAESGDYEEVAVDTEDYGAVLFRMENGAHGVFHVSEVSAATDASSTLRSTAAKPPWLGISKLPTRCGWASGMPTTSG